MTSSPTALVPWMPPEGRDRQALASTTEGPMQKSCASPMRWSVRNKWLIATSVVLAVGAVILGRSEEHTSELQSLMRISYAVFCLKKKRNKNNSSSSTTCTHSTYNNQHASST